MYLPRLVMKLTWILYINLCDTQQVFGPVMTIFKVENNDDEKCIEMVNSTNYGLGSSVFSGNQARGIRLGHRIRAGMTTVNDFAVNYLVQVSHHWLAPLTSNVFCSHVIAILICLVLLSRFHSVE